VHTGSVDYANIAADNGMMFMAPYVIEARFRLGAAPIGTELSIVGAMDAFYVGFYCTLRRTATGDEIQVYRPGDTRTTKIPSLDLAAAFTARLIVETKTITCDIKSDLEPGGGANVTLDDASRIGPIGFEARAADALIDYVIVYTH
jgi:hypothetical protein